MSDSHGGSARGGRSRPTRRWIGLGAAVLAAGLAGQSQSGHRPAAVRPVVIVAPATVARPVGAGPGGVSRAFVAAYAGFVYGRLGAAGLPGVSAYLRRQLAAERPDPPARALAAADPRLRRLTLAGRDRAGAQAVAVIADGPSVYRLVLGLRRRRGEWTITSLTEAG